MKLVSACLLGINCNYKGVNNFNQKLFEEFKRGELLPICPEILGNLPVPRISGEIKNGTGLDVINGKAKVIGINGDDFTNYFIKGAEETLRIAKTLNIKEVVFKAKSPSCGCGKIYDGSKFIDGDGVTTALLKKNGINVITEENI